MDTSTDHSPGAPTDVPGGSLRSVLTTDHPGGVRRIVDDAFGVPASSGGVAAGLGLVLTLVLVLAG